MTTLARFKQLRRRIQHRRYRRPAILGDENGLIDAGIGKVWVRFQGGTDANGDVVYDPATVINAGSANHAVYAGAAVWCGYDDNDEMTILSADHRDLRSAGISSQLLNAAHPANAFIYLRNVWRLLSRPVGRVGGTSTYVYVNPLVYMDNYGDFNVYAGTPKLADKVDLSSFIPSANNHRIAVVALDTVNNTVQTVASTTQAISSDIDSTDYQECFDQFNAETIPVQAYLLQNNVSFIDVRDLAEDLRQFINVPQALGFPNPIDKNAIIRDGRTSRLCEALTVSAGLTVAGSLTVDAATITTLGSITITTTGSLTIEPCPSASSTQAGLVEIAFSDHPYTAPTANKDTTILVDTTAGNVTVSLPALADNWNQRYSIKNTGIGTVTIDPNASETIDGQTTLSVPIQYDAPRMVAGSSEWSII